MFETFEIMYAYLWECIYNILKIFGIEKDEEGNLVDVK